jgi:hypothetical protein
LILAYLWGRQRQQFIDRRISLESLNITQSDTLWDIEINLNMGLRTFKQNVLWNTLNVHKIRSNVLHANELYNGYHLNWYSFQYWHKLQILFKLRYDVVYHQYPFFIKTNIKRTQKLCRSCTPRCAISATMAWYLENSLPPFLLHHILCSLPWKKSIDIVLEYAHTI